MNGSVTPSVTGWRAVTSGAAAASFSLSVASCVQLGPELRILGDGRRAAAGDRRLRRDLRDELVVTRADDQRIAVAGVDRLLQRPVEDVQHLLVEDEAERRRRDERDDADDEADPKFRQMLDEAQPVVVRDGSQRLRHR